MPPSSEELTVELEKAFKQRLDYHQAEIKRYKSLHSRASKLRDLYPEDEPTFTASPSKTTEELNTAFAALMTVRERNAERQKKYEEQYAALLQSLQDESRPKPTGIIPAGHKDKNDPPEGDGEGDVKGPSDASQDQTGPNHLARPKEISFDEVYRDGEADPKDTIVEFPRASAKFYILRCSQCALASLAPKAPLLAAGRHLDTPQHGHMNRSAENAIKVLGIRVLNCNTRLMEKNNHAYVEWFNRADSQTARRSDLGKRSSELKRKRRETTSPGGNGSLLDDTWYQDYAAGTPGQASTPRKRARVELLKASDIKAGDIYCHISRGIHNSVVVILPLFEDWPSWKAEVLETPDALGFWSEPKLQTPEAFFEVDPITDIPRDWRGEFRDGGSRVSERQYPVIFIEGEKWDESCTSLDWVSLDSLCPYNEGEYVEDNIIKGAEDYSEKKAEAERRQSSEKTGQHEPHAHPEDPRGKERLEDNEKDIEKTPMTTDPREDTMPRSQRDSRNEEDASTVPERSRDTSMHRTNATNGHVDMAQRRPPSVSIPPLTARASPSTISDNRGLNGIQHGKSDDTRAPHTARPVPRRSYGVPSWNSQIAAGQGAPVVDGSSDVDTEDDEDIPHELPPPAKIKTNNKSPRRTVAQYSPYDFGSRATGPLARSDARLPPKIKSDIDPTRPPYDGVHRTAAGWNGPDACLPPKTKSDGESQFGAGGDSN